MRDQTIFNPRILRSYGHQGQHQDVLFQPYLGRYVLPEKSEYLQFERNPFLTSGAELRSERRASGNQVIEEKWVPQQAGENLNIICFEMKVASLVDALACHVNAVSTITMM
jgi:hypothetical protein